MPRRPQHDLSIRAFSFLFSILLAEAAYASCAPTPPGQIPAARGTIVDFSGRPLAGARIQIFAAQPRGRSNRRWTKQARALLSVSADSTGAFDFSTLLPGTYFLEVSAGQLRRTLLAAITPRPANRSQEIRLRLLGVECNAYEVTTQ
jgi:hypothetical protein